MVDSDNGGGRAARLCFNRDCIPENQIPFPSNVIPQCPGTTPIHKELEKEWATFIGKDDCITFGMGFATNSICIPALVGKGCLIISDALNHSSIVAGVRGSGAKVKVCTDSKQHAGFLIKCVRIRSQMGVSVCASAYPVCSARVFIRECRLMIFDIRGVRWDFKSGVNKIARIQS